MVRGEGRTCSSRRAWRPFATSFGKCPHSGAQLHIYEGSVAKPQQVCGLGGCCARIFGGQERHCRGNGRPSVMWSLLAAVESGATHRQKRNERERRTQRLLRSGWRLPPPNGPRLQRLLLSRHRSMKCSCEWRRKPSLGPSLRIM